MPEKMRDDEFDAVFAIMEQSFPKDEYRPYEEQRALLEDPRYTLYVHRAKGGEVDAFLAVWQFEAFAFLEHFAVTPRARNCGLGRQLLCALTERLDGGVCLEAEPPDTPISARRVAFYRRAGFTYHDDPYVQPPISAGKEPVPLRLMTHGFSEGAADTSLIRRVLYREVYRVDADEWTINNQIQEDEK